MAGISILETAGEAENRARDEVFEERRRAEAEKRNQADRAAYERGAQAQAENHRLLLARKAFERECHDAYWAARSAADAAMRAHDLENAITNEVRCIAIQRLQKSL